MEERSALKQAVIEHYERMIEWAKNRPPTERVTADEMLSDIKECWSGKYCPLCIAYGDCGACPIVKQGMKRDCEGTPWDKIYKANNWKTWLLAAEEELEFLESLDF